jgi:HAD superfamily hydrolase (TIGR01509 family)
MSSQQPPFAVLWDMDGTLIDSEHHWLSSERELAIEHGVNWTPEDGLDLVGMSLFDSSEIIKTKLGSDLSPQQIVDRLTEMVTSKLVGTLPWRPGAIELLRELKKANIKTALVTMSLHRMAKRVADAIDFEAFDLIVAGDDVQFGKPHPEPYLKAAELLGIDPSLCIALEDSKTGLTSAELAGTKAIGIPNVVAIPAEPGRIIWPTLQEITLADLQALFKEQND